jgi:1-acyl-sn-glycerol-3-phosphate acyltransferase
MRHLDPDDPANLDTRVIELLRAPVERLLCTYFRAEVFGLDQIPHGPAVLVGNHNAGITALEPFILGATFYRERGTGEKLHFLVHDKMVELPLLGELFCRLGGVRASPENALRVLESGGKVVVYPGGNREAFRPFSRRHQVDLAGRTGFIKLALEAGVPIVPLVHVGGHETFFVLHSGRGLARLLRLDRLIRSETCALIIALPWGLSVGPVFHLPLPAKSVTQIGAPIVLEGSALDPIYLQVIQAMQRMMDQLASRRGLPVLG